MQQRSGEKRQQRQRWPRRTLRKPSIEHGSDMLAQSFCPESQGRPTGLPQHPLPRPRGARAGPNGNARVGVPVTDCVWCGDHWSQGGWARPQPPSKTRTSAAAYPGTDTPWLSYQILGTQAKEYEAPLRSRSGHLMHPFGCCPCAGRRGEAAANGP